MKKLLVLALVAMVSATGFGKTIDEVFNAFPKADNVQEMTMDKEMLAIAMSMGADQSMSKSLKDIDAIRIVSIENPTAEQLLIAKELMKDGVDGFDEMVDVSEEGEDVLVLTQGDGKMINKLLVISVEEDEVGIALIEGKIDVENADKIIHLGK